MRGLRAALHLVRASDQQLNGTHTGQLPIAVGQAHASLDIGPATWDPAGNPLSAIVWADLLGSSLDQLPMSRTEAMMVPAVAKARHVVAPKIASAPLVVLRGDDELPEQPSWITRTDAIDDVSPWHRMLWTVDDLIFTGWSLWAANRGSEGQLLAASRIMRSRWSFDKGQVKVDGEPVPARSVILIPGPHEGIVNFGAVAVRHARELIQAASNAGKLPTPTLELHQTTDVQMTDAEIDAEILRWAQARQGVNAGVAWTSYGLEAKEHNSIDGALLIEGRNAAAVDIARIVGVAAAMIDATVPKASLNYETTQGRGLEHAEYGIEPYADSIAARLSLDDVVPRGQRTRFDISADLGAVQPTGPTVED